MTANTETHSTNKSEFAEVARDLFALHEFPWQRGSEFTELHTDFGKVVDQTLHDIETLLGNKEIPFEKVAATLEGFADLLVSCYNRLAFEIAKRDGVRLEGLQFPPTGLSSGLTPKSAYLFGLYPKGADEIVKSQFLEPNATEKRLPQFREWAKTYVAGSLIDPSHPVTWYFATIAICVQSDVTKVEYLKQIRTFKTDLYDDQTRVRLARSMFKSSLEKIQTSELLGPDIPVIRSPHTAPKALLWDQLIACMVAEIFELPVLVGIDQTGSWCQVKNAPTVEAVDLAAIKKGFGPVKIYSDVNATPRTFVGHDQLLEYVNRLRQAGLEFPSLPFPTSKIPLGYDPMDVETPAKFFARDGERRTELTGYVDVILSFTNYSDEARCIAGFTTIYPSTVLEGELKEIIGRPPTVHIILARAFKDLSKRAFYREMAKPRPGRMAFWDNGRLTIHLRDPIPGKIFQPALYNIGDFGDMQVTTLQTYLDQKHFVPLDEDCIAERGDERFNKDPYEITYDSLPQLMLNGLRLGDEPLDWGYDPQLKALGFPTDEHGRNCLTNFRRFVFPLVKPPSHLIDDPLLQPIRGFRHIPVRGWMPMLHAIKGDRIENLIDIELPDTEVATDVRAPRLPNGTITIRPPGQFYKEPRERISIVGRWIVSHCKKDEIPYFIVDSPLYGDALFIFKDLAGATAAAAHLSNYKERRDGVRILPGFVDKVVHSAHWKEQLQARLDKVFSDAESKAK